MVTIYQSITVNSYLSTSEVQKSSYDDVISAFDDFMANRIQDSSLFG